MTRVIQRGLTSRNEAAMELFADRLDEYNRSKGFIVVEAEATEDQMGVWNWELIFKSRQYARDFWTDPKYQKTIKEIYDAPQG